VNLFYKVKLYRLIPLFLGSLIFFVSCERRTKPPERAFPVTIGDVSQEDTPIYIEAIGNVYSLQTVQLRPQVSGVVVEAYVKQGQYVKKGDPLYKIDPRPYQAALDQAKANLLRDEANLKYAQIQVERNKPLLEKNYLSKLNFEQFGSQVFFNQGQVESDKAAIATAALNLEWCTPVSPLNGKVSQYNIDPGNLVTAYDTNFLIDIRQMDPADIRFGIAQNDFVKVQEAMRKGLLKFEVILPQLKDTPREGQIYFIDNHLDTSTGTILLRGTVPNQDEFLWPGEFIRIRLMLHVEKGALLVSEEAVKIGQDGPYVYIYHPDTSTAEYRLVTKGEKVKDRVIIKKGVKLGEKVILRGQNNLLPGVKVYIPEHIPSEKGAEAGIKESP
jgi:multidrug efflux system membrane fusion protein